MLAAARQLGYEKRSQRGPARNPLVYRQHEIPACLQVMLLAGGVHSRGSATIISLNEESALLADLELAPPTVPIAPAYLTIAFRLNGQPLKLRADFDRVNLERFIRLRVKWADLSPEQARLLAGQRNEHSKETD